MRIVCFSDIHANLPALDAFFHDVESVDPDAIYCLGDLVGYNVWANEVTNEIRRRGIPTIMGNHDEALQFEKITESRSSNRELTREIVTDKNRNYLTSLPRHITLSFPSNKIPYNLLLAHGSIKSINDYMLVDYPEEEVLEMMAFNETDVLICGHTHKPFHRIIKSQDRFKHVINIGSVGKPKDGDPRICYAIFDLDHSTPNIGYTIKVSFKRVAYDVERAARAVEESAFDDSFAVSLRLAK